MYTQEELLNALHEAGADGRPFTLSTVRTRLGLPSGDKHELDRFRRRVRSLQKAADSRLERVGNNSYRLKAISEMDATNGAHVANDVAPDVQPQLQAAVSARAQTETQTATQTATQTETQTATQTVTQPAAATANARAAASARPGLCARSLAMGQLVAHFVGVQYAHRHEHKQRLRELALELKPKAEALRAVGMLQIQALRERVAAGRRPTA